MLTTIAVSVRERITENQSSKRLQDNFIVWKVEDYSMFDM